jgi:hypothetical protein
MTNPVDKDSLKLNQPKRTPNHPTKSHIVKTKVDGKEKIIRFGQQGASTAGKPKDGESDRMKAKRASFKARHSANIAKGPSSAAYWANKVKWSEGGLTQVKKYAKGGEVEESKAAFGIYPKQRATPSSKETKNAMAEAAQFAAEMLIPQTAMDAGLMLIPGGRIARKAGAALIGLDASDAEAGALTKMLKAFHGARKPIEGKYDVSKASEASIMGRGLNVSTDPAYPSKWAMRPGSEAPTVYETMIPIESIIQLEAKYPADSFDVLRKIRGRNPLPEGEVTGEQVYQSLRGLPQSMIPDVVLKSGYKGAEYPAQDKGRWFSIYDTEGVKDRSGKKFAEGGLVGDPVTTYDPFQVDEIMNSIDTPRGYAEGGSVNFAEDNSVSAYDPDQIDAIANQFM